MLWNTSVKLCITVSFFSSFVLLRSLDAIAHKDFSLSCLILCNIPDPCPVQGKLHTVVHIVENDSEGFWFCRRHGVFFPIRVNTWHLDAVKVLWQSQRSNNWFQEVFRKKHESHSPTELRLQNHLTSDLISGLSVRIFLLHYCFCSVYL